MVLKYKDKEILTLEDIQRLTVKDLRNILKSNSENAGGMKADLVLKVYALLMRDVVVRSVENTQQTAGNCCENSGHFKYDETMRQISALVIKFDPRSPNQRTREENSFKILSESLQNCLPASSFFLFHDIKSNCVEESDPEETNEAPESVPF